MWWCPFSMYLDLISMWPLDFYIYNYGFYCNFIWFLWNIQRCKHIILLSSCQLITVVFIKHWCALLQYSIWLLLILGDNWSLTSKHTGQRTVSLCPSVSVCVIFSISLNKQIFYFFFHHGNRYMSRMLKKVKNLTFD